MGMIDMIIWIVVIGAANAKEQPCRPNPCFNGGRCFRVSNNTRTFQCRCREDYIGERCESTDTSMSAAGVICPHVHDGQRAMEFTCPDTTTIVVEYAAYGRPSNESAIACRSSIGITRPCVYDGSLAQIMTICHGLMQCSLPPLDQLFLNVGQFCKNNDVGNYALEYRFRCQFGGEKEGSPSTSMQILPTTESSDSVISIIESSSISSIPSWCHESSDYFQDGTCYRVSYENDKSKRKSWKNARDYCISRGGELVESVTEELHGKLAQRMSMFDERKIKYFWIGARVVTSSDSDSVTVQWNSGNEATYIPDGSKLDEGECLAYYVQPGRTDSPDRLVWLAKSCSLYYNWICQFPVSVERTDTMTTSIPTSHTSTIETEFAVNSGEPSASSEEPSVKSAEPSTSSEGLSTSSEEPSTNSKPSTPTSEEPPTPRTRPKSVVTRRPKIPIRGRTRTHLTRPMAPIAITSAIATITTTKESIETNPDMSTEDSAVVQSMTPIIVETTITPSMVSQAIIPFMDELTTDQNPLITPDYGELVIGVEDGSVIESKLTNPDDLEPGATFGSHTELRVSTPSRTMPSILRSGVESINGDVHLMVPEEPFPVDTGTATILPAFITEKEIELSTTMESMILSTTEAQNEPDLWTPEPLVTEATVTSTAHSEAAFTEATSTAQSSEDSSNGIHSTSRRTPVFGTGSCGATTERGIEWPVTSEGRIAEISCPIGTEGKARWECQAIADHVRFFPAQPDLRKCHQLWFQELQKQVVNSQNGVKTVQDLFRYLTLASQRLYGGDIKYSLVVIRQLIDLQAALLHDPASDIGDEKRFEEAMKFTQAVGTVIDFWMIKENMVVWQDLPLHPRLVTISELMTVVEESANFLSSFTPMDNATRLNFTNFMMKIEVRERTSLTNAQHVSTPSWYRRLGLPVRPLEEWNKEPDLDAVSQTPVILHDFGVKVDLAQISIPAGEILAASQADQRNVDGLSRSLPFADSPSRSVDNPVTDDRVQLGYFVYLESLSHLLQPPHLEPTHGKSPVHSRKTIVNSVVIGATVNDPRNRFRFSDGRNVTITLKHLRTRQQGENVRCVYWNLERTSWDTDGCSVVNSSKVSTTCTCNHMTNFAILMDITGEMDRQADLHKIILKYLTLAACGLSSLCLAISILVFTLFRSLWSVRNGVHRNLCACLLTGELLFLFGVDETQNREACTVIAILLHYFFLAAFCWMFIEGYQLYSMLVRVFEPPELSQLIGYYVAAYGAPAIVVAFSVGLGKQHYGTSDYCWINANSPIVWAFVGPVAFVMFSNMVFLAIALKVACRVNTVENRSKVAKIKGWLKGSTMLLCLLGLTWVFGFFFVIRPAILYFAYIFTVMNSLQGMFIFIFHVLLNDKVRAVAGKWFKRRCQHCWPNYYIVNNSRSRGSSNESRHLSNHFTGSTGTTNYGFPSGGNGVSSFSTNVKQCQHEEMLQKSLRTASNDGARRRKDKQQVITNETSKTHSSPNSVQIFHRTCDERTEPRFTYDDTGPPTSCLPVARFPITGLNVSAYSREDQEGDGKEPLRNRFYYTSSTAQIPQMNERTHKQAPTASRTQKLIERF